MLVTTLFILTCLHILIFFLGSYMQQHENPAWRCNFVAVSMALGLCTAVIAINNTSLDSIIVDDTLAEKYNQLVERDNALIAKMQELRTQQKPPNPWNEYHGVLEVEIHFSSGDKLLRVLPKGQSNFTVVK